MQARLSSTEENYLKAIYKLTEHDLQGASTNAIAEQLQTRAASVTDMLKKLAAKLLIDYKKYQGVTLTPVGRLTALSIIRRHRLWEVFLVQKLNFGWDEIHEIAEELEHVSEPKLIQRLDDYLGNPTSDPHGDLIPSASGELPQTNQILLNKLGIGDRGMVIAVFEHDPKFLQYLDEVNLNLGKQIKVLKRVDFDGSMTIGFADGRELVVSKQVSSSIFVQKNL
jgi:DtxR family Mn-dependent transcriptional regulator